MTSYEHTRRRNSLAGATGPVTASAKHRREFLIRAFAASGASLLGAARTDASDKESRSRAQRPLRILILGGTGTLGSTYVPETLSRGHHVSVLVHRGHA